MFTKQSFASSILFFCTSFLFTNVWAASFEKIKIPGARCGDGSQYYVFMKKGHEQKLLIEFMGGGVCWDRLSCASVIPRAWIYPIPKINSFSVFTADVDYNPFKNHTMIYFPYCTGDVHAGDHIENYQGKTVHHVGFKNVTAAFNLLTRKKNLNLAQYDDVTVWGASAGAIGTLLHAKNIEAATKPTAKKTMIIDSPGLHYGKKFWQKFSASSFASFQRAFSQVDLKIDYNDGLVAKDMAALFHLYRNWKIGVLLPTRDIVMSVGYGNIRPGHQERLILSDQGLPAIAESYSNVHVWMKKTYAHTFFIVTPGALMKNEQGISALKFAQELYK